MDFSELYGNGKKITDEQQQKISAFVEEEIGKERAKIAADNKIRPTILLSGKTKSGKSSLINYFCGENIADVQEGAPTSQGFEVYEPDDTLIRLIDSKGHELEQDQEFEFIDEAKNYALQYEEGINAVWYLISAGDQTLNFDIDSIKKYKEAGFNIAVVYTKIDLATEKTLREHKEHCRSQLKRRDIPIFTFANLKASSFDPETKEFWEEEAEKEDGDQQIEKLYEWTKNQMPNEDFKNRLATAQSFNEAAHMAAMKAQVKSIITQQCATAAAIGAIPIPFADGPLLVGNQALMVNRILSVYKLNSIASSLTSTAVMGGLTTAVGRSVAGSFLKFFPGVGSIIGGAINAATAVAVTAALGASFNLVCLKLYNEKKEHGEEAMVNLTTNMGDLVESVKNSDEAKKAMKTMMDAVKNIKPTS